MKIASSFFLTTSIFCIIGCKTALPPPPPPRMDDAVELDSAYMAYWGASVRYYRDLEERLKTYTKYSIQKRRRFYPFNRATTVHLAYFDHRDSNDNRTLPFMNGAVDLESINVLDRLNTVESDSLTDILYNSQHREYLSSISKMACYYPRNAILFSDKENKVFDYIEICFDCHQFKKSRDKVRFDPSGFPNHSFRLLEQFFEDQGLPTTGPYD